MGPPNMHVYVDVFMVNNTGFLGGQNLYFSWFGGAHGSLYEQKQEEDKPDVAFRFSTQQGKMKATTYLSVSKCM